MSEIDEAPATMRPCASCGCHHRATETACPHCGRPASRSALGSGAVLLGLAMSLHACQSMYGVTITDYVEPVETAETGDTSDTSDTGTP